MISYAYIDRIEGKFAVCEVELLPFEESNPEDFKSKETVMMDIPMDKFPEFMGSVNEGDVWVVNHNNENVKIVYYKDEEEKARRLEIRKQILS